jgi:uncharacterized protein YbjT (DUF2867 family)
MPCHERATSAVLASRTGAIEDAGENQKEIMTMKIVVIGGSGLIGSKVISILRDAGHEAVAASPNTGVDTLTGEGLAEALAGASVVVDVSNSPSFEDDEVLRFFETSTANLLDAEAKAGVGHHVALSIVGTDRWPENGYFRAKMAQEQLIEEGPIPYTIVRATQFFEFVSRIADASAEGDVVRIPPVLFQPMAADDVARAVADAAVEPPANRIVDVAGPDVFRFDELVARVLRANGDRREVVADPHAGYFGARPGESTLVPSGKARLGETHIDDWLGRSATA